MTSPRRSQQQRRSETERRVLDAAIRLIAIHGSRPVSLAEIGQIAGYSRGIVAHHFGNRSALLAAVVRDAQIFEVHPTAGTGLDRLCGFVADYLRSLTERALPARAFLLLWAEAVAADPDLAPLCTERDAWFRGILAGHLRTGVADGSIRGGVDPDVAAVALVGLLRGIGLQLATSEPPPPADRLNDQTTELVRRALMR